MERQFFRSNPWNNPSRYSYYHPRPQPQPQPTKPKVISVPVHFVSSDDTPIREPQPKPIRDPEAERMVAVMRVQRMVRGFLVRKNLRVVRKIEAEAEEIHRRIEAEQDLVRRDEKERLRLNEMLMRLLFRLDSVRGVRDYRKRVIRRVIALQEAVDSMAGSMEMGTGEQGGEPEIPGEGDLEEDATNANSNLIEEASGIKDLSGEPMEEDISRPQPEEKTTEIRDIAKDRLVETIETTESAQQGGEGSEETPEVDDIAEMKEGREEEILGERDLKEGSMITNSNPIEDTSEIKDLCGEPVDETQSPEAEETIETKESVQEGCKSARQPREIKNFCSDPIGENFEASGAMEKKGGSSGSGDEVIKEVMERVAAESEKLRGLVAKLCERSAQQCMMMGGLAQRVENLERTVQRMEAARKKKKVNKHRC